MRDGCVFCDYDGPSEVLVEMDDCYVISPLYPVTPGHLLVVSREHVEHFGSDPQISGLVAEVAARLVGSSPANIITSIGPEATQTVKHLHLHIVPRRESDGLALPWDPGAPH